MLIVSYASKICFRTYNTCTTIIHSADAKFLRTEECVYESTEIASTIFCLNPLIQPHSTEEKNPLIHSDL